MENDKKYNGVKKVKVVVYTITNKEIDQKKIDNAITHILDNYSLIKNDAQPDVIYIKPNLCYYWHCSTGQTTDPRVVLAVIRYFRNIWGKNIPIKIVEADASAMRTHHSFQMLGYEKLANEEGIELINLSKTESKVIEIQVGKNKMKLPVPLLLKQENSFLINIAKVKYHRGVLVTGAMKNLFGAIPKSYKLPFHKKLTENIIAINKWLYPKPELNILDGITALGKYPIKLGTLIASQSAFGVDYVAAKILGYRPMSVSQIKLAKKIGIGNPKNLEIIEEGESIKNLAKKFPRVSARRTDLLWAIQIRGVKLYAKLIGDAVPPMIEKS